MPETFDPSTHPHRRRNALTGDWVVVSPQRTKRPWQGQTDEPAITRLPDYDPDCYLCPGNERVGGEKNPDYTSTFVFENDFAALLPDVPTPPAEAVAGASSSLYQSGTGDGECRVICFSPKHGRTLATMDLDEIGVVVDLWKEQHAELLERFEYVQLFETRGAISGASNPHPHGQIWSSNFLPNEIVIELEHQRAYHAEYGQHLLLDYVENELATGDRVIMSNDHWVVTVPYWAYWPYETIVLPRRRVASLLDLTVDESEALAEALRVMLRSFDRLFNTPFPYCSGWHTAPRSQDAHWQLHAHYYPPLLKSADVAKIPAS
ncbi:MAG: galactose-1-phosphate uridylyltransferase, partial [Ilumatobacter sp.]|nr:galactose-1-phosphate uridylyltransferase [Ilumatobacter sp.]